MEYSPFEQSNIAFLNMEYSPFEQGNIAFLKCLVNGLCDTLLNCFAYMCLFPKNVHQPQEATLYFGCVAPVSFLFHLKSI